MELRSVKSWERRGNSLVLGFDKGRVEISFSEKDVLRFRYNEKNEFNSSEDFIVNAKVANINFELLNRDNYIELSTGKLMAQIKLNPFGLSIFNGEGREIISSQDDFLTIDNRSKAVRFRLIEKEGIYGLGQDPMANLNQRDKERRMWQQWGSNGRSGNGGVPFMMSTNGYGILLNSSFPSRFAIGRAEVAEFSRMGDIMAPAPWSWDKKYTEANPSTSAILLDGDEMDLFIICRDKFDDIMKAYYDLTGYAPMLPKWAYGFMQCKNRYRSQGELLKVARRIREKKIPCDVLIIDWLWFKEFGDVDWDRENWPDAEGMLKELSDMGFKVMQAQHPFLSPNGLKFDEFKEEGYINKVPEGKRYTFDHSNPEARKAWWKEFRRLFEQGIRGYWTDMGELEEHFPGTESYLGGRDKVHNIYSLLWAKGLYDGQRSDFGERVITLARTTYAGMQKYGATLWSGDIDATWETLKRQVVVGQEVCMSGMPYWTTDVGGFITNMDFTPELYVRWLQWGVFCPLFRTHGTKPGNEPWSFGKQTEDIVKEYIGLRYSLIPYIYSCASRITEEGTPLMRAMVMDFPEDQEAVDKIEQFMFGPSILVAPVLEKGVREKEVYLPEGDWFDYWSDKKYEGKSAVNVSAPLNKIPLFIKAGSIIPMGPEVEYLDGKLQRDITVHVYPGADTSFELYDDDGHTYAYEDGDYIKTMIDYREDGEKYLRIYPVHANEKLLAARDYTVVLHDMEMPEEIQVGSETCNNWIYSEQNRTIEISCKDISISSSLDVLIKGKKLEKVSEKKLIDGIKLFADTDVENDGKVTVNLTIDTLIESSDVAVSAKLIVPEDWTIRKSNRSDHDINAYWKLIVYNEDSQETKIYPGANISWEVTPLAEALPLMSDGHIEVEYMSGRDSIYKTSLPISWGSGYITRWSTVGSFENPDNSGFEYKYEPETNPDKPYYEANGRKLSWIRDVDNEFNCFGYVDLRRLGAYSKGEAIDGVAYLRCRVWSDSEREAHFELSAESGIRIWLNSENVYNADTITVNDISSKVHFKKGWNELLIKTVVFSEKPYSGREYGFNVRIVDKKGQPVNDLLYLP